MKKNNTDYTLHLLLCLLGFAMAANMPSCYNAPSPENSGFAVKYGLAIDTTKKEPPHVCYDSTHYTCDGYCTCDGMECPPPSK